MNELGKRDSVHPVPIAACTSSPCVFLAVMNPVLLNGILLSAFDQVPFNQSNEP